MLAYLKPGSRKVFPHRQQPYRRAGGADRHHGDKSAPSIAADEVNVYSSRKEALIKPLLDRFSEDTGLTVKLVTGKPHQLIERMAAEGRNSPADLLITADAGNLARAKADGLLRPCDSTELDAVVPEVLPGPG